LLIIIPPLLHIYLSLPLLSCAFARQHIITSSVWGLHLRPGYRVGNFLYCHVCFAH
jgi:hypothetical protein